MPNKLPFAALIVLGIVLWAVVALSIHLLPGALTSPTCGSVGFVASLPLGWLSVRLVKRAGRLTQDQLLPGVALVGATAMMLDGLALEFAPTLYSADERTARLSAAWLLWGYGVSLAVALAAVMIKTGAAGREATQE